MPNFKDLYNTNKDLTYSIFFKTTRTFFKDAIPKLKYE